MSHSSAISLQITYKGGRPLAAYLYLSGNGSREVARSEQIGADLVVDFAPDGSALGLEILSPESTTIEHVWAAFDRLGLARPPAAELSPLPAA